jgi:hypothetical protein
MTEEMKIDPATATPAEDYPSLNHLRVMIKKKRKWNSYWDWPDPRLTDWRIDWAACAAAWCAVHDTVGTAKKTHPRASGRSV